MSFALPPVKPRPEHASNISIEQGTFGVPDTMMGGLAAAKSTDADHFLMQSERNYAQSRQNLNMVMLRNTQGLHAPLRIAMELKAAKKVGQHSFLPSSNVMLDSLTGRDLEMGPEDVFNTPEFREAMGQPHAVMEKSLNLL